MVSWFLDRLHLCCVSGQGEVFWFGRRSAGLRLHRWFPSTFIWSGVALPVEQEASSLPLQSAGVCAGLASAPAVLVNASVYLCGAEPSSPVKLFGF